LFDPLFPLQISGFFFLLLDESYVGCSLDVAVLTESPRSYFDPAIMSYDTPERFATGVGAPTGRADRFAWQLGPTIADGGGDGGRVVTPLQEPLLSDALVDDGGYDDDDSSSDAENM
jgi:hypothetical protein